MHTPSKYNHGQWRIWRQGETRLVLTEKAQLYSMGIKMGTFQQTEECSQGIHDILLSTGQKKASILVYGRVANSFQWHAGPKVQLLWKPAGPYITEVDHTRAAKTWMFWLDWTIGPASVIFRRSDTNLASLWPTDISNAEYGNIGGCVLEAYFLQGKGVLVHVYYYYFYFYWASCILIQLGPCGHRYYMY